MIRGSNQLVTGLPTPPKPLTAFSLPVLFLDRRLQCVRGRKCHTAL